MATSNVLREYHAKRDLPGSGDPGESRRGLKSGGQRFVVQLHDASSLHFDFRLEIGGVLVSWSIPKGPSLDPGEKRLAIRTEDQPLDHANGRFGAGSVIVWDAGELVNRYEHSLEESLDRGSLGIWLEGEQLHGAFRLVRTRGSSQEQWLLIKKNDEGAATRPKAVLTGLANEELV
ncbi:DNA polymerase ligase N-terminal domain-containing protein [Prauserella cavernicola]|uniref:DNA ligase n=1 Tax=Prauserella cavernicola TaxID=2800127 RepID=A0A934QM90_9PSEU|nr:DNA polymerase ligase N-terminal domain-containing protein [Prauserella cavernicola]MBK1784327.1 DNA ligase [Prauserella cavernicola]